MLLQAPGRDPKMYVLAAAILITFVLGMLSSSFTRSYRAPRTQGQHQTVQGFGAFVEPGAMVLGNWYPLEFVVGPDAAALEAESEDLPLTVATRVYLARVMRVTLLPNPNFEIAPPNATVKDTGEDLTEAWQWNVRPLHDGTHRLIARVEVGKLRRDRTFVASDGRTRRVSIRVKIGTWQGFVRALRRASTTGDLFATLFASWEKTAIALTGLLGASGGVWLAIRGWGKRKRKRRAKSKPKEPGN